MGFVNVGVAHWDGEGGGVVCFSCCGCGKAHVVEPQRVWGGFESLGLYYDTSLELSVGVVLYLPLQVPGR